MEPFEIVDVVPTLEAADYELVTYAGRVWLDVLDGNTTVTDTLTLETCSLPKLDFGMAWQVDVHPDTGLAVAWVSGHDEIEPIAIHERALKTVWRQGDVDYLVQRRDDLPNLKQRLLDLKLEHVVGNLSFQCGLASARSDCELSVFKRPRAGSMRVFIPFKELWDALQPGGYNGRSTRWINGCRETWTARLNVSVGQNHIVLGVLMKDDVPLEMKCLPRPIWDRYISISSMRTYGRF
jgi:hypothetical protein